MNKKSMQDIENDLKVLLEEWTNINCGELGCEDCPFSTDVKGIEDEDICDVFSCINNTLTNEL